MGTLQPIDVPWTFGLSDKQFSFEFVNESIFQISSIATFQSGLRSLDRFSRLVILKFDQVLKVAIRNAVYDEEVSEHYNFERRFEGFSKDDTTRIRQIETWHKTQRCPDPFFYEVVDHVFLQENDLQGIYRVFLVENEHTSVTVVSKNFQWS